LAQNIYARVVISYGIDHQLVYVVNLLITILLIVVTGVNSVDINEWISKTSDNSLKRGKLPGFSNENKMMFPEKPQ